MKGHESEQWIEVRRMPPGRRQWVFDNVRQRLPERHAALRAMCEVGSREEATLLATLLRFKGGQGAQDASKTWPREVVELDVVLDRQVAALANLFRAMAGLFAGTPAAVAWEGLVGATFPSGVTFYTAQPYVEESSRVAALLAELSQPSWSSLTAEAAVRAGIDALVATHVKYAGLVGRFDPLDRVSWDAVKAHDLANHRRLCVLVAGLVYELADNEAAQKAALGPVAHQDQEVYEALRARRKVLDVDPTTGEPIDPSPLSPTVEPTGPTGPAEPQPA